jgi:hypothetical protein
MATKHIADKESKFVAVSTAPDFCRVGNQVVPFDISRKLNHTVVHAKKVFARGVPVLRISDVIQGVDGDAGQGVISGTAKGSGDVIVVTGADNVYAEKLLVARHLSVCQMN